MPSLRQLEYLIELDRHRHFRRAAEALGVSQPTLSTQVKAMEDRLGLELIERGHGGVLITPMGKQVLDVARRMIRDRQEIFDLAKAAKSPMGGVLRLGLPWTIGPNLLPLILPELHKAHPNLNLRVREDVPGNLPQDLETGVHDLLLVPMPVKGPGLAVQPIFREPLFVALAEDHPLAAKEVLTRADLRHQKVLTLEKGHQFQEQVAAICEEFGAELAFDFEGTSLDTVSQMVAMGAGISFLPGLYVERAARVQTGIVIRTLHGRALSRTIGAVWRASSARADDYQLLVHFIRNAITKHFPKFLLV